VDYQVDYRADYPVDYPDWAASPLKTRNSLKDYMVSFNRNI